jgi:hypothetical protein
MTTEKTDHDRTGEHVSQETGIGEPLGVGHGRPGQPQSVRDAAEVDQHEQQLDHDPYP